MYGSSPPFARLRKAENARGEGDNSNGRRQVRRVLLDRELEQQAVRGELRFDSGGQIPRPRVGKKDKKEIVRSIARKIPRSQTFRAYDRIGGDEDKYRTRLPSRAVILRENESRRQVMSILKNIIPTLEEKTE